MAARAKTHTLSLREFLAAKQPKPKCKTCNLPPAIREQVNAELQRPEVFGADVARWLLAVHAITIHATSVQSHRRDCLNKR